MSTGGLESLLYQEEKVPFDTQDAEQLENFIDGIALSLKSRAGEAVNTGGGDVEGVHLKKCATDGFSAGGVDLKKSKGEEEMFKDSDDEWILESASISDVEVITIEDGASLFPVGESFSLPDQAPVEPAKKKDVSPVGERIPQQQSILKKEKGRMIFKKKSGVNGKEDEKKKKKKNEDNSACQRCSIIRTLMIQGVKKTSGMDIQEDVEPFINEILSKRKCKNCKKILTVLSG